jgi:selenocysteine lyase/cysteine desulfurase
MTRLLDIPAATAARLHAELEAGGDPELPGAVRASIGLATSEADIDALVGALQHIAALRPLAAVA